VLALAQVTGCVIYQIIAMLLGVDVGTTHTKAGVYDHKGRLVVHARIPTNRINKSGAFDYRSPDILWQDSAALIKQVVGSLKEPVAGLAVSSMGEAGVPLDSKGRATFPIIPWNDTRAASQMEGLIERLPPERWSAVTGLFPNPIHSIAKWVWIRETEPEAWSQTSLWLSVCNYLSYRLTGEAVMEASQACRTMAFDIRARTWAEDLLSLAGLAPTFLPPVVDATHKVGEVTAKAASETGLVVGTPVFAGGHDHFCAALACGVVTPDVALDSLGTAEALTLGWKALPDPEAAGGFSVGIHVIEDHSYLLGGLYSSGGTLQWLKQLLGLSSFEELRHLAQTVQPAKAPLFVAHFFGSGPPFNDPASSGAFVNLDPDHGPEHLARAVVDGLAFEIFAGVEKMEQVTGLPIRIIRLVGVADDDDLSPKVRASVLGRPVEVPRHSDMVTMGNALIAGIGLGVYDDALDAVDKTYQVREVFEPEEELHSQYREIYDRNRLLVSALRESRKGE
jgi:xylulokinase